jgi:hypothetical protein
MFSHVLLPAHHFVHFGHEPPFRSPVLASIAISGLTSSMSAAEIIEQFKALPPEERAEVTKYVVEHDDSWIPEDFKQGMADAVAGRIVDMEIVMSGAKPPSQDPE